MELKNHKSAWATLATLGITAVAAGATAFVKMRQKRRKLREQEGKEGQLTADQMMVYNEAISSFIAINKRIFELRRLRKELQPLIRWLATTKDKPATDGAQEEVQQLAADIDQFLTNQLPAINAMLSTVSDQGLTFVDHVRGSVGGQFDATLDEEPTGAETQEGMPIVYVLKLGYYFPNSTLVPAPVKSIVLV